MVCHQDQCPVVFEMPLSTSVSSATLEALIQNGPLPLLCSKFSSVNMCSHFTSVRQPAVAKLHRKISQTCLSPFKSLDSSIVPCINCEVTSYSQSRQRIVLRTTRKHPLCKNITTAAEAMNAHYQTTLPSNFKLMASLGWFGLMTLNDVIHKTQHFFHAADEGCSLLM